MYRHPRSAYARQYGLNAQLPSKPATNSAKRSQTLDAIIWRLCRNNYGAATPRNQATANLFAARSPIVPVSRIIFAGTRANGRRLQLKVQRREIPSPPSFQFGRKIAYLSPSLRPFNFRGRYRSLPFRESFLSPVENEGRKRRRAATSIKIPVRRL